MRIKIILIGLILANWVHGQGCILGKNLLSLVMSALMEEHWNYLKQDICGMPKEAVLSVRFPAVLIMQPIMPFILIPQKLARLMPDAAMIIPSMLGEMQTH